MVPSLKLVTWNCRMAFDKKWPLVSRLGADLLIVQECARPEILAAAGVPVGPGQVCWTSRYGGGDRKGLGVFSFNQWKIRTAPLFEGLRERWRDRLDVVLPIEVIAPFRMNLLAVWSFNNRARRDRRRIEGPVLLALAELHEWSADAPTIVCGDFNNNVRWDTRSSANSFATAVARLQEQGLRSAYHSVRREPFGMERLPTHYWRNVREDGPSYHIDYCFIPEDWIPGVVRIEVGAFHEWCGPGRSDHVPLILEMAAGT